jgi:hemerythrin-like domain-containing protein
MEFSPPSRRDFLRRTSTVCGGLALPAAAFAVQKPPTPPGAEQEEKDQAKDQAKEKSGPKDGEEISPAEDLMREHGVLNRILLIYDEHLRLLAAKEPFDGSVLTAAADIVRHFVEDYHEKLEEDFLFPRFRKAGKLVSLVTTLQKQHAAGRELTAQIRELAATATLKLVSDSDKLGGALRSFLRMYRPHEAREDTVLFPAFRSVVSAHEYDALGDDFEKKEDELFGEDGYFKVVDQVAQLEKRVGIYEISQFTPQ